MVALRAHFSLGGTLDNLPDNFKHIPPAVIAGEAARLRLPGSTEWQYHELSAVWRYTMWVEADLEAMRSLLMPHRSLADLHDLLVFFEGFGHMPDTLSVGAHYGVDDIDTDAFSEISDPGHLLMARLMAADASFGHVFEHMVDQSGRLFYTPDAALDALHALYPIYGSGPMYWIHYHNERQLIEHAGQFGVHSAKRVPPSDAATIVAQYRQVGPKCCDLIKVPGRTRLAVLEWLVRAGFFVPGRRNDRSEAYPSEPSIEDVLLQPRQWEECEDLYLKSHRYRPDTEIGAALARPPQAIADRLQRLTGDSRAFRAGLRRAFDTLPSVPEWSHEELVLFARLLAYAPAEWLREHLFFSKPGRTFSAGLAAAGRLQDRLEPPTTCIVDRRSTIALAKIRHFIPATDQTLIRVVLHLYCCLATVPASENDYRGWLIEEDALIKLLNPLIGCLLLADLLPRRREAFACRAQSIGARGSAPVGKSPRRLYGHIRLLDCEPCESGVIVAGRQTTLAAVERLGRCGHWIVLPPFPGDLKRAHQANKRTSWDGATVSYLTSAYHLAPTHLLSDIMGIDEMPMRHKASILGLSRYQHSLMPSALVVLPQTE